MLGKSREAAMWDEPVATLIREQAAYLERNGQSVEWDAGRTERLIEALERLTKEKAPPDGSSSTGQDRT